MLVWAQDHAVVAVVIARVSLSHDELEVANECQLVHKGEALQRK